MKSTFLERRYAAAHFGEVMHTTLNPEGPGVVRIHLIPPVVKDKTIGESVAILNGQDIVPVGRSWSILLAEFITEVNKYSGREITDEEAKGIVRAACKRVRRVYPFVSSKRLSEDIFTIMNAFKQIAYGETVDIGVGVMNIGEYAPLMRAPHRMDLMVSAMTKEGNWHCNQKCVHCYAAGQLGAEEEELTTEQWKAIIDKCRAAGIPQLTFTGGEPTMREDLVELIDHARWFVTRLNSNGIKLTEELCAQLKEASLDSLQITFYSDDAKIHNRLVGAERYDDTVAGIKNALAAGISVSINTPLCTVNKNYLNTIKFLKKLGVTYVTCSGLITTGNATTVESESLQLDKSEIEFILSETADYCFANGMEISFTSPGWVDEEFCREIGINPPSCGACLSNMAITPGGNVVPCQSWLSGDVLGNMLNNEWDTVWNNEKCKSRRAYSAKMLGVCPLRRERHE